jgi:non-ribosomal peptide synthase protein (TIGR01720 family)
MSLSPAKQRLLELMLEEKRAPKTVARQDLVTGDVAITPPQAHELEIENPDRHMFNLPLLLEVHLSLDVATLEQILLALVRHHDAVRLCSIREDHGWRQFIAEPPSVAPVSYIDLRALPDLEAQSAAIEARVAEIQKSFDIATGPLLKAAYFDLGPLQPARLLVIAHHIACDHHSSSILLQDFLTAYQQLHMGQPITLPDKTVSYLDWSWRLKQHARSRATLDELPYWRARGSGDVRAIPLDDPDGENIGCEWKVLTQTFDLRETPYLAASYLKPYGAQLPHVLIAAAARSLIDWTGGSQALIAMCHHGRQHPFKGLDITRTVGWFAYQYPLLIDLGGASQALEQLQLTKLQIDSVPNHGLNHGVLRYMADPAIAKQLEALPDPEVFLNIRVGTRTQIPGFLPAREQCGDGTSPTIVRTRHLYLNVNLDAPQLSVDCLYNPNTHRATTIERFLQRYADHLRALNDALRPEAEVDGPQDST